MASSSALAKRSNGDVTLMPPPPIKRIKRPATVLDEDEYTEALADIIARDYFPGLAEVRAQEEYLSALESKNEVWIVESAAKLRDLARSKGSEKKLQNARNSSFDTPRSWHNQVSAADTPRGDNGDATPMRRSSQYEGNGEELQQRTNMDTSNLSLSQFQAKYTSEDNESFNTVLDKQNSKHRQKHAHLWTSDQRIPSNRLIAYRDNQMKLLKQQGEDSATAATDGRELIPLTSGAVSSRPAQPDSWRQKKPENTFMFNASSVDEDGLLTVMEVKEAQSKAGPKQTVYANTRFPPLSYVDDSGSVRASPSLNTSIIARRDAARARNNNEDSAESSVTFTGGETPRVNGYAFVDEDEPENLAVNTPQESGLPSYRDLLAGQVDPSGSANPFTIHQRSRREELHHRLVDKEKAKRLAKEKEITKTPLNIGGTLRDSTPGAIASKNNNNNNMTPAARKLMEKLGRTPVANQRGKVDRLSSMDMWTPGNTPRRK